MDIFLKVCILSALVIGFAGIIKKLASRGSIHQKKPKLPSGSYKLFYSDEKNVNKKEDVIYSKILYSPKYDIQGKPDFIYQKGEKLYPAELKSGNIGNGTAPHQGDLLQLGAYFLIIEDVFEIKPPSGWLIYNDTMFIVKNTAKFRHEVLGTIHHMRDMLENGEDEPKTSFMHCKHCVCKNTVCEYCED